MYRKVLISIISDPCSKFTTLAPDCTLVIRLIFTFNDLYQKA